MIYRQNHTQIPNAIIDDLMRKLKGSELKIFLSICRKTIGWHKETDTISTSQLMAMTGLSNRTVIDAVTSLKKRGIITVQKDGKKTKSYEIAYEESSQQSYEESSQAENLLMKKVHKPYEESSQGAYEKSSHTKETITKETIQKKERASEDSSGSTKNPDQKEQSSTAGKSLKKEEKGGAPKGQNVIEKVRAAASTKTLFEIYRRYRKKKGVWDNIYSAQAQQLAFAEMGLQRGKKALEITILNGWKKLVEPESSGKVAEKSVLLPRDVRKLKRKEKLKKLQNNAQ